MKKALLLTAVASFCIAVTTLAQQHIAPSPSSNSTSVGDTANVPYWIDMMKDPQANFFQTQRAFELYWQNRAITPGCGYKQFKRWEHRMKDLVDDQGNRPAPDHIAKVALATKQGKSLSGNWMPLGPNFDITTETGDFPGTGRLNTIAFHPTDSNIVYVGAPAGGLWRTENYGDSWIPLTDQLPTLGVSAIVVDREDPNTIYIGTGDRDSDDAPGLGVWRSIDNGVTWSQHNVGMGSTVVNALIQDYDDANVLLAATDDGVFRSTDKGANWLLTTTAVTYKDLVMHPTDHNTIYTCSGRIFRSNDNGETWTMLTGMPSAVRIVLSVSPATPDYVYATLANQRSLLGFYRSTDAGQSFTELMDSPNILGYQTDGSDASGGQSWYDLALVASPTEPEVVYSAGIHVWKSDDGGYNWWHYSNNVHVDMHAMAISPHTDDLFLANDGGLYIKREESGSWKDISHNLVAGQIYKLGQSAQNVNKTLNGFQDNGTGEFDGTHWRRVLGGDGMECQFDPSDDNYAYGSIYYGAIYRRVGDDGFRKFAGNNTNGMDEEGAWVTPFQVSPSNGNVLFTGFKSVWRTTNLQTSAHGDITWEKIGTNLGSNGDNFSVLAVSAADSNRVYCVKGNTLYFTTNAMDSANQVTWTTVTSFPATGNITDVLCHPYDPNIVYITKGVFALKSTDGGATFSLLGSDFNSLNANCIAMDTSSNEGLYVGTVAGVFYKDASMTDWVDFSNGLPMVLDIREINLFPGNNTDAPRVRLASYGRGLWESDLYGTNVEHYPATAVINQEHEPVFEIFQPLTLRVGFYKNLNTVSVTGFDQNVVSTNATILDYQVDGNDFVFTIEPSSSDYQLWFVVPTAVANDQNGLATIASDTFHIMYQDIPTPLGWEGPGGVGNTDELALWLRADQEVYDQANGTLVLNDGDTTAYWGDISGHGLYAAAVVDSTRPVWSPDALNGRPAVKFDASQGGTYFVADSITPGQDFSAFVVVQAEGNIFNDHGWMASSRQANGFILHNRRNTNSFYAHVRNDNDNTTNGTTVQVDDLNTPHIYGVVWSENELGGDVHTVADNQDVHSVKTLNERSATGSIDIQLGQDRNDRPGNGFMGEHIIYRSDLRTAQLRIVKNYLAARYGIDLYEQTLYDHGADYGENVAGIGQHDITDYHFDAKGPGMVRMNQPSSPQDGAYLMWGHNMAGVSAWAATEFEGVQRIERTWRVDETGDLGSVQVLFDMNDLPPLENGEVYALIIGPDSGFTAPMSVLTLQGATELSAVVDFRDDEFFTVVKGTPENLGKILIPFDEFNLQVFPNPSDGDFAIQITNPENIVGQLNIYNNLGQIIDSRTVDTGIAYTFNAVNYSKGIYYIEYIGNEQELSLKVVVY